MTTETDLRTALADRVDADVDVEAFRDRLNTALADQDTASVPVELDLQYSSVPAATSRAWQRWSVAALAACLAAVAAVIWFATRHTGNTPPSYRTPRPQTTSTPHVMGVPLFPGSKVLGVVHGTGSRTVLFPAGHAVPARHEHYMVFLFCSSGHWRLRSGPGTVSYGPCGQTTAGSSVQRMYGSVHVQVQPNTTWQLGIAIEPDALTNANLETGTSGAHAGPIHRGNGVVTLRHSDGLNDLRMTCTGTGFRLTGMNGTVKGDYTHTCFAGFVYVWHLRDVILPVTLRVHADAHTTWTASLG